MYRASDDTLGVAVSAGASTACRVGGFTRGRVVTPRKTDAHTVAELHRTLDMSAGDGSDECEQEPEGDGSG